MVTIKMKTTREEWLTKQAEESKRKASRQREIDLTLISKVRSLQPVKSLTDDVTIYIEQNYSDYGSGYDGMEYKSSEIIFHASIDSINRSVSQGEMTEILKINIEYGRLIELYFSDNMFKLFDDAETFETIEPEYDSIEGDVIVGWSWEKYIGYCRKLEGLHFGRYKETEVDLITGNEESTFRSNYSILCKASELEGLTEDEKVEYIENELNNGSWKWSYFKTPKFTTLIERDLSLSLTNE